jgi:hypothetical protein
MRELLGRAIGKKSDELLGSIERLITGKPSRPTPESVNLYATEIDLADKYLQEVLGKGFLQAGRLELIAHPVSYNKGRITDLPSIDKLLRSNKVYLRGWDFPHLDKEKSSNFNSGLQSFTDSEHIREGFRFYQSGLLVFKRVFGEDLRGGKAESGNRTLSFISAIYTFTEFSLFLKRVYEELDLDGDIHVVIRLVGCKDRELAAYDGLVHLEPWYVCKEDVVTVDETVRVVELKADNEGVARRWVKHVFHVFNWNDLTDETTIYWQKKLIERRL